jgi:hypothetical protein
MIPKKRIVKNKQQPKNLTPAPKTAVQEVIPRAYPEKLLNDHINERAM